MGQTRTIRPLSARSWRRLLDLRAGGRSARAGAAEPYGSLLAGAARARAEGRVHVVAHLAQSLDGRIATGSGDSQWISNCANLEHVHRLRALCDAVLVGRRTLVRDDPRLTVRHVAGPDPLKVIVDPLLEIPPRLRVFERPESCLVLHLGRAGRKVAGARYARIWDDSPGEILRVLAARGIHSLLVEGGGAVVSRFLEAGLVDALQLHVAPVVIGSGVPSLSLGAIDRLAEARRFKAVSYNFGGEVLFECRAR